MEFQFNISGAGGILLMGEKTHNASLRVCKIHFLQRDSHGLIGAPVQNPDKVAEFSGQNNHLPKM